MFQEALANPNATCPHDVPHPALVVLEVFKSEEATKETINKLRNFMEETAKVLGENFETGNIPASQIC